MNTTKRVDTVSTLEYSSTKEAGPCWLLLRRINGHVRIDDGPDGSPRLSILQMEAFGKRVIEFCDDAREWQKNRDTRRKD